MSEIGELLEEWDPGEAVKCFPSRVERSMDLIACGPIFGPGIYALCRGDQIIYVGKAIKLIIRIYAHWNSMQRVKAGKEASKGTKGIIFTSVKVMACDLTELDILEEQMIARYRPKYNQKKVPKGKVTLEQIGFNFTRFGVTKIAEAPVYRRRIT